MRWDTTLLTQQPTRKAGMWWWGRDLPNAGAQGDQACKPGTLGPRGLAPGRRAPRRSGLEHQYSLTLAELESYRKVSAYS